MVLFLEDVDICMCLTPLELPKDKDSQIQVLANPQMSFVLKYGQRLEMFAKLLLEAYVMLLFESKKGF